MLRNFSSFGNIVVLHVDCVHLSLFNMLREVVGIDMLPRNLAHQ